MMLKTRLLLGTVLGLTVSGAVHLSQKRRHETLLLTQKKNEAEEEARRSLAKHQALLAADRSQRHPVVNLLEDSIDPSAPRFIWDNAKEDAILRVAASAEARKPGAAEALDAAFRNGRFDAAALLWQLRPDPELSEGLINTMRRPQFSHLQESGFFALGMIGDAQKIPDLWRELRRWENEPKIQVAAARAIHKSIGGRQAAEVLEKIALLKEDSVSGELTAPELAAAALKDLGLRPQP